MRHSKFLWFIVSVSFVAISLFPIYTVFFLTPGFAELLVENTKDESYRLATYFSTFVATETGELKRETLPAHLLGRLASLRSDGHLTKMRIFSAAGEIIYSTEPSEIGRYNRSDYFRQIQLTGTGRTEVISPQSRSLENEVISGDVIETYVPIVKGGRLLGIFELYHNVSKERRGLNTLIYRSYGTLVAMAAGLLALVVLSSYQAFQRMKERGRIEEQLKLLSLTDDLTGLYNRRGFLALAEQQLRLASRDEKPMTVISADLDGLKAINDSFGHQEGSAAIVAAANILRECFRKSDVIARIGGDEFALLLTGGEAEFDRDQLGARLQTVVENHNRKSNRPYRVSVSAGFANFNATTTCTFEELLHRADEMMYEQKRQKRGGSPPPSSS